MNIGKQIKMHVIDCLFDQMVVGLCPANPCLNPFDSHSLLQCDSVCFSLSLALRFVSPYVSLSSRTLRKRHAIIT